MKEFTEKDVVDTSHTLWTINIDSTDDLIFAQLTWQKRGLSQTASGYGNKLTSRYKIRYEGKDYRLYVTCFSNTGSTWFTAKGRRIYVN